MKLKLYHAAAAAAMALSVMLLTACGSPKQADPLPIIKLRTVGSSSEAACQRIGEALSELTAEKFGFTVEISQQSTTNYNAELERELLLGKEPDIFCYTDAENMFSLAADGTAEPLDDWLEEFPTLKEAVSQDRWNCMRYDGKLIAVPSNNPSAVAIGFEVRADVLDELGIDAASIHTMDDMHALLLAAKQQNPSSVPLVPHFGQTLMMLDCDPLNNGLGVLLHNTGTEVVNLYDTPEYEELCNQMHQWYTEGLILKDVPLTNAPNTRLMQMYDGFAFSHRVAEQNVVSVTRSTKQRLTSITLGSKLQNTSVLNIGWCISSRSEHKREGMQLLQYLYTDREAADLLLYGVEGVDYTCQCVVTKSAQSCMTNDPKQRPMFASFDGVFNTILFTVLAIVVANIANKHADVGNYTSTQFFHEFWMMTAIMSAIFTVIAVISIAPKDRPEFFGTGKPIKVGLKDYWDTLKNNRAIQMLVLSASTDKLGSTAKTSAVAVAMFACIAGSIKLQGSVTAITTIPSVILTFLVISIVATRFGQKKAMVIGSIGGIICNVILSALWIVGDPTTMTSNPETGALNWGPFLITYVVFSILYAGCQGISGNIVIPMTADCADYEVYRSGKYVPGLMGTLFSFVDKMISSFAPMIAGLVFAACGFTDHNPSVGDIVTPQLRVGVVFLAYGLITIGLICNLIAMKFYPLSKEKMAEIQDEIVKIKAKAMAEA